MSSSRRSRRRYSHRASPLRSKWCARASWRCTSRGRLRRSTCASVNSLDKRRPMAAWLPQDVDVHAALLRLQEDYATRGVNLVRIGGKWTFRTASDLSWLLSKESIETRKLSRAAIETLAIVAYHQPVTRTEIEEIRGVSTSKGSVDVLLQTGWIRPRGRRKAPGRPVTCGTTDV